ncbi:MAG: type II secretion system protein [Dehalococcoidia bacterium]|nr:type II secretion system protein [Dehalococcoidia bacterium]
MKSLRKACRGQKGFTLIELLVVIIILGVLAAVVTLAVTRFIGKGVLESANAELRTVQTAVEAALGEANASQFDDPGGDGTYAWDGSLESSPICTVGDNLTVTAYEMMRTHKLKAVYTIERDGDVINGNPNDSHPDTTPWGGTKIQWNSDTDEWERAGA